MKKTKANETPKKGHDVETPSPPQVMDPSAPPEDQMAKQETKGGESNPSKRVKKEEDRKLTPNEEL